MLLRRFQDKLSKDVMWSFRVDTEHASSRRRCAFLNPLISSYPLRLRMGSQQRENGVRVGDIEVTEDRSYDTAVGLNTSGSRGRLAWSSVEGAWSTPT